METNIGIMWKQIPVYNVETDTGIMWNCWYRACGARELCESGGGRAGLHVPNSPYGLCGRKATLNLNRATLKIRVQELCESGGGRAGLPVPNSPYGLCGC